MVDRLEASLETTVSPPRVFRLAVSRSEPAFESRHDQDPRTGLGKLKRIVVLMMENRSFDHMLGALKAQDAQIDGLTGNEWNPDTTGAPAPCARSPRTH